MPQWRMDLFGKNLTAEVAENAEKIFSDWDPKYMQIYNSSQVYKIAAPEGF